jgi:hypothetical protein
MKKSQSRKYNKDRCDESAALIRKALEDTELMARMKTFGFDLVWLQEGLRLQARVTELAKAKEEKHKQKKKAVIECNAMAKVARAVYSQDLSLSRYVFIKDSDAYFKKILGLIGAQPVNPNRMIEHARSFYLTAMSNLDVLKRLQPFNVTKDSLNIGLSFINDADDYEKKKLRAFEVAINATQEREDAYKTFRSWMYRFRLVRKLALNMPRALVDVKEHKGDLVQNGLPIQTDRYEDTFTINLEGG